MKSILIDEVKFYFRILSIKGRQQTNNINSLLKAYMDCLLHVLEHHSIDQLAFLNDRVSSIDIQNLSS